MSVKAWVMVPLRFTRPAPYSATLDAQWDLLSLYFPWSCTAIAFYSPESVLQSWEYRQTFCVLTCAAPVRRADQTQRHDCVYQRFIGFSPLLLQCWAFYVFNLSFLLLSFFIILFSATWSQQRTNQNMFRWVCICFFNLLLQICSLFFCSVSGHILKLP